MAIRNCVVVAIEGVHGSGKSTMVSSVVGHFRALGLNVGAMTERARESPLFEAALLYGGHSIDDVAELHILGDQIAAEQLQATRNTMLIVDRSLMNVPSYWKIRYPDHDRSGDPLYLSMKNFVQAYCQRVYDLVVFVTDRYVDPADPLRETDESFRAAVASQLEFDLISMGDRLVRVPEGLSHVDRLAFVVRSISSRLLRPSEVGKLLTRLPAAN